MGDILHVLVAKEGHTRLFERVSMHQQISRSVHHRHDEEQDRRVLGRAGSPQLSRDKENLHQNKECQDNARKNRKIRVQYV